MFKSQQTGPMNLSITQTEFRTLIKENTNFSKHALKKKNNVCKISLELRTELPSTMNRVNCTVQRPCLWNSSVPLSDIYSSISALMSSIRDVFRSLFVEPKAFSNRSCFFLWIDTILSSTESFTMNCST